MEETDRDQKKKSIIPQLPSCFMSPETPGNLLRDRLTPCFDSPSSIFPTPPCSQEKESISHFHSLALDEFPRLNFELDESDQEKSMQQSLHRSPLMPEDRVIGRLIGIKSVDFISDLLAVNGNKICQRICSYLEPLELCRFASVSRTWRNVVKGDTKTSQRWKGFLRDCKDHCALKGKENYGVPTSQRSSSNNLKGFPLKSVDINKPEKKISKLPALDNQTTTPVCSHPASQQTLELRPCPKCVSPSYLSQTQGHCQCQKCGLRFCSVCLRESHHHHHQGESPCDGLPKNSGMALRLRSRKLNNDSIGSKKTKDRVRRL